MFHTYQCYVLEQSRACRCFLHTSVMYWNSPEPVNVSYIPVLCIGTVQSLYMFLTYQCYVLEQSRACKCFIHTSVMYWNSSEPVDVSYIPVLCIGTVQSV